MKNRRSRMDYRSYVTPDSGKLPEIENYLENTFRQVTPRPDFVTKLKTNLADPAYVPGASQMGFNHIMLVLMALTTTVLIVAGFIKFVFELVSALRIMRLFGHRTDSIVAPELADQLEA